RFLGGGLDGGGSLDGDRIRGIRRDDKSTVNVGVRGDVSGNNRIGVNGKIRSGSGGGCGRSGKWRVGIGPARG
ncbi:hypothetical protein, partial [Couchioplanes caeruleus]|uniref:hypothetical protein n=1 Tax=Couchioplanes caeruleus TaxID=56438 RepID=UPI000ACA5F6F